MNVEIFDVHVIVQYEDIQLDICMDSGSTIKDTIIKHVKMIEILPTRGNQLPLITNITDLTQWK